MTGCKCGNRFVVRWIKNGETETRESLHDFSSVEYAEEWIKSNLEISRLVWWVSEVPK